MEVVEEFWKACIYWCNTNGKLCGDIGLALKLEARDEISPGDEKGDKWGVVCLCQHLNSGIFKHHAQELAGTLQH